MCFSHFSIEQTTVANCKMSFNFKGWLEYTKWQVKQVLIKTAVPDTLSHPVLSHQHSALWRCFQNRVWLAALQTSGIKTSQWNLWGRLSPKQSISKSQCYLRTCKFLFASTVLEMVFMYFSDEQKQFQCCDSRPIWRFDRSINKNNRIEYVLCKRDIRIRKEHKQIYFLI